MQLQAGITQYGCQHLKPRIELQKKKGAAQVGTSRNAAKMGKMQNFTFDSSSTPHAAR